MTNVKLVLASLLCLSSAHSLADVFDQGRQVYQAFYDEDLVGSSERVVRNDEERNWIVESNNLLFESFFGDSVVLGLSLETFNFDQQLKSGHYISQYDDYLFSSMLKPRGEAAFIQTLMVYELTDGQQAQTLNNWSLYLDETAQSGELSSALKALLFRLDVTESYSVTIERSKFDYTIAEVSDHIPMLLSKVSPVQVRLFDPESEGSPYVTMSFEVNGSASDSRILQVKGMVLGGQSDGQESHYQYTLGVSGAVLSQMVSEQDGEVFELKLVQ